MFGWFVFVDNTILRIVPGLLCDARVAGLDFGTTVYKDTSHGPNSVKGRDLEMKVQTKKSVDYERRVIGFSVPSPVTTIREVEVD